MAFVVASAMAFAVAYDMASISASAVGIAVASAATMVAYVEKIETPFQALAACALDCY